MSGFMGREAELKMLRSFTEKKTASLRPVLIHVGGVDEELLQSDYFSKIIDFSEIFRQQ